MNLKGIKVWLFALAVIVFWLVGGLFLPLLSGTSLQNRGQFGDSFGAVNALFTGLALLGVVYAIMLQTKALGQQQKELELLQNELELQRQELKDQRKQFTLNRQLIAMDQIVSGHYTEAPLRATNYRKLFGTLSEARHHCKKIADKDDNGWVTKSVIGNNTLENATAYELSLALERVGSAANSGQLNLYLLLPLVAGRIVEDWVLCEPFVSSLREEKRQKERYEPESIIGYDVYYHRRHAEWLAMIAARWLVRLGKLDVAKSIIGHCIARSIEHLDEAIVAVSDWDCMFESTQDELMDLFQISQ